MQEVSNVKTTLQRHVNTSVVAFINVTASSMHLLLVSIHSRQQKKQSYSISTLELYPAEIYAKCLQRNYLKNKKEK